MEIINNFLDERDFTPIENTFTNSPGLSDIAWFYSTKVGTNTDVNNLNHSYFIHTFPCTMVHEPWSMGHAPWTMVH